MNTDGCIQFCISSFQICLTCEEAFAVNCAGGDKANALTVRIHHQVAVVRHTNALVVETTYLLQIASGDAPVGVSFNMPNYAEYAAALAKKQTFNLAPMDL